MRYFVFISDQKSCYFCAWSATTTANRISFRNHRNRKVVGGKHNVLVHYVDVSAPDPSGVVLCNPFIWDILWFILIKNHVIFVPTTLGKRILFCNHRNKKVVGGMHNVLVHYMDVFAPDPSDVVLCNPFKFAMQCCAELSLAWFILWLSRKFVYRLPPTYSMTDKSHYKQRNIYHTF